MVKLAKKGVLMLVSAISANSYFVNYNYMNNKSGEIIGDTTFNSLTPFTKKNSNNDLTKLYDSINKWKHFCENQIANGKLDVIA